MKFGSGTSSFASFPHPNGDDEPDRHETMERAVRSGDASLIDQWNAANELFKREPS
jgi:hypothetical protein